MKKQLMLLSLFSILGNAHAVIVRITNAGTRIIAARLDTDKHNKLIEPGKSKLFNSGVMPVETIFWRWTDVDEKVYTQQQFDQERADLMANFNLTQADLQSFQVKGKPFFLVPDLWQQGRIIFESRVSPIALLTVKIAHDAAEVAGAKIGGPKVRYQVLTTKQGVFLDNE